MNVFKNKLSFFLLPSVNTVKCPVTSSSVHQLVLRRLLTVHRRVLIGDHAWVNLHKHFTHHEFCCLVLTLTLALTQPCSYWPILHCWAHAHKMMQMYLVMQKTFILPTHTWVHILFWDFSVWCMRLRDGRHFVVQPAGLEPHFEGTVGRLACHAGPPLCLFPQRTPCTQHALWSSLPRPANNKPN